MKHFLKKVWQEQDGVLAFEWTLLLTLLVIGIVSGVSAARDAIIDELGDTAEVMLAVDQSYHIAFPLNADVHATDASTPSDTTFVDAQVYTDCDRFLGPIVVDQLFSDDFIPDGA